MRETVGPGLAVAVAALVAGCALADGQDTGEPEETAQIEQGVSQPCGNFHVQGVIEQKYYALGGRFSFLGCPTTNELATPDAVGRFNHFQGGSIYWTPATGAWSVRGAIRDRWANFRWERGPLGYPISDENDVPNRTGKLSRFQNGIIYWSPASGAHVVYTNTVRDVFDYWGSQFFYEAGRLGYPIDELRQGSSSGYARCQDFQGGSIHCGLFGCYPTIAHVDCDRSHPLIYP